LEKKLHFIPQNDPQFHGFQSTSLLAAGFFCGFPHRLVAEGKGVRSTPGKAKSVDPETWKNLWKIMGFSWTCWVFSWDSCGDFIGIFMGCNQIFMGWDLNGILVDIVGKMASYCFSFGCCGFF
jgi:hypothetical protein